MEDVRFTTFVNKASGDLMLACWTGKPIKKATLYVRKQGEKQQDYYVVRMDDVFVAEYHSGASTGSVIPADSFTLNFSKIKFEYRAQKADGSLEAPTSVGYDLELAKSV